MNVAHVCGTIAGVDTSSYPSRVRALSVSDADEPEGSDDEDEDEDEEDEDEDEPDLAVLSLFDGSE